MKLHNKMLLAVLFGSLIGLVCHDVFVDSVTLANIIRYVAQPIGQIFLRLLFMLVVPLIFCALVLGVAEIGNPKKLGKLGAKTLLYTVFVSSVAVILGVVMMNLFQPGKGYSQELRDKISESAKEKVSMIAKRAVEQKSGLDMIIQIVPENPVRAAADMDMMGLMFFALMIGVGLTLTQSAAATKFKEALQGLYDVTMELIALVISLAPYGVFALMFAMTAQMGYEILLQLARYVGVVLLAMFLHQFVVYSLTVKYLGKMSPLFFFKAIEEAMLTAFSTASSNATLPTALRVAEKNLKLPSNASRFVLTVGSTTNQNGTALFEGMTVLFLAQFYGVDLTIGQQVMVTLICIMGGVGTAGVPAASLPVVAMILGMLNIPVEGIGLILGVDRFLDMCRTTLNVTGDLAAAVVVSRGEKN